MSAKTGIQWTEASWNPIRGCSRVSEGCRHCYAEEMATRFSGPGQPYEGLVDVKPEDRHGINGRARSGVKGLWNGKIAFIEERLEDPIRWRRPRRIFVNSMSDLFHENVTEEMLDRIFAVMYLAKYHTFQVLTKRPERAERYLLRHHGILPTPILDHAVATLKRFPKEKPPPTSWPLKNVWIGTSVEDQKTAEARIPHLLRAPAAVRFISAEPLLGHIDLTHLETADELTLNALSGIEVMSEVPAQGPKLDWVIPGGESGRHARGCNVWWIRSLVRQCQRYRVACFVKQLGRRPYGSLNPWPDNRPPDSPFSEVLSDWDLKDKKGGTIEEWPEDLQVREYPRAA